MTSQTPIQIHIPPSLHHLTIPLPTFLTLNKQYTNLAVGSFIFHSSKALTPAPHLLIVQRAATERGFPNKWEVPGGSCEASDPTILHSLARETFEETGLRLTRFRRQIGSGSKFVTGYGVREKQWLKLSFEIDVAEIGEWELRSGRDDVGRGKVGPGEDKGKDGANGVDGGMDEVGITLDPEEHQAYAWATEEEIKEGKYAIVTAEQQALMLEAFALRKADEDKMSAMLDGASGAVSAKEGSSKETSRLPHFSTSETPNPPANKLPSPSPPKSTNISQQNHHPWIPLLANLPATIKKRHIKYILPTHRAKLTSPPSKPSTLDLNPSKTTPKHQSYIHYQEPRTMSLNTYPPIAATLVPVRQPCLLV